MNDDERLLEWIGSSYKDLMQLPADVRKFFGYALNFAQQGEQHAAAKVLKGFGGAGVLELVENDAGAYAPSPQKVADTVEQWLREGPEALARRAQHARRIANPNAVWEIAEEVWAAAHRPPVRTSSRAQP